MAKQIDDRHKPSRGKLSKSEKSVLQSNGYTPEQISNYDTGATPSHGLKYAQPHSDRTIRDLNRKLGIVGLQKPMKKPRKKK